MLLVLGLIKMWISLLSFGLDTRTKPTLETSLKCVLILQIIRNQVSFVSCSVLGGLGLFVV